MIVFLMLAGVQVTGLLLAARWLQGRLLRAGLVTPEAGWCLLVSAVRRVPARGRRALYAAANGGRLRRRTWNGCAFNRAGEMLETAVHDRGEAALALGTTADVIGGFLNVWDRLSGSDRYCTALLRDALEHAGLFDEDDIAVALLVAVPTDLEAGRHCQATRQSG